MDEVEAQALQALRAGLHGTGVACDLAGSALALRGPREATLYIGHLALEHRRSPLRDTTIVGMTVSLAYTWAGQRHTADSRISGLGNTIEAALADAAQTWASCMAPPLLSALRAAPEAAPGQPKAGGSPPDPAPGAELVPAGDPAGLPGWHAYSSPYVLNDDVDDEALEPVMAHLDETPLLATLAPQLLPALDRTRPFSTLSLQRAQSGAWIHAECQVDGQPHEELGAALAALPWPEVPASQHLALRLFVAFVPAEPAP